MKISRSITSKKVLLPLLGLLSLMVLSCTKKYDAINTNKNSIPTIGPSTMNFLFSRAESVGSTDAGNYQIAQNLFADQYCQYFACEATYFPSDRLTIRQDWVGANFNPIYTQVVPQIQTIWAQTDTMSVDHAVAEIWWVFSFHKVTDYWGPIPYFNIGSPALTVPYDPQDKIYADFFRRLDEAVAVLTPKADSTAFNGSFDLIFGGDCKKWIKFANSLKLRLALRVSNVTPDVAKTEAESAVTSGVMETSPDDDALILRAVSGGDNNGLSIMSPWNEFRMSATMESVLKGYSDPRLPVYFLPTVNSITADPTKPEYNGLRNGLDVEALGQKMNLAAANSHQGFRWADKGSGGSDAYLSTPQNVMESAEAWFNRAEGATKGWAMGGTAEELYNKGITQSMNQWGLAGADVAYSASTATPVAPGDYLNSPAVSNVPIKFSADPAMQLKQIATQKWLALYPDGMEAWADYRRQHILPLYPVVVSDNPLITDTKTQWLRRIPFLTSEKQTNGAAVADATNLLGGPDTELTPLWWDKN